MISTKLCGCGLSWSTLKASNPEWTLNNRMTILLQTGASRHPELPNVPLLREKTSDPANLQTIAIIEAPEEMGRPFTMPPGTPAPLVAIIRKAFMDTMTDKEFVAEAAKTFLEIDPVDGATMQKSIEQAYAAPKDVIARAAAFVAGKE